MDERGKVNVIHPGFAQESAQVLGRSCPGGVSTGLDESRGRG
jgi:hypothetical protein